jgi:DUF1680 family protein
MEHLGYTVRPDGATTEHFEANLLDGVIKLIPYYAWANRESASMQVWIPYQDSWESA